MRTPRIDRLFALPPSAQALIRSIEAAIDEALPLLGDTSGDSAFSVRQTRASYLPQTVGAYLAIPESQRSLPDESGATAENQLMEQLSVLDRAVKRDLEELAQRKRTALAVNARFLAERFEDRSTEISPTPDSENGAVSQALPAAALRNWLPANTSDAKTIVAHLGTKLQVAFPQITQFGYSGVWGLGRIESVIVTLQQAGGIAFRYTLSARNDILQPAVTKLVHNVSIQTIQCSVQDWVQSLYDDLSAQARHHNETRNALERLLH